MVASVASHVDPGVPLEGVLGPPVLSEPAAPVSLRRPTADRNGRGPIARFFVALTLSLYGDWLSTVALVVVLFELTGNPAGPAGYILVRVAPRALGPWWGGTLADRGSPRRTLIVTSTVQAAFTAALIVAHRNNSVWAIFIAVAIAQFAGALGRPSQGAMLPTLVSDAGLARANATYGLLFSTSIFVAPAIGAGLLLRVGPDLLFAIDAVTFLISAALVATLAGRPSDEKGLNGTGLAGRSVASLLPALRQRSIRMVAIANFANGLTVTVTQALLVVAAHERFGGDASVGYLYASVGIGGALGGLIAIRRIPPRSWTRLAVMAGITAEVVALAGFSAANGVLLALLLLAASAVAATSLDTWGITEVQRSAPPGLMGRYNSIIFISMYSGMLVGAVWALATSSILHWDVAIEVACAAMLVLVGLVWISGGSSSTASAQQEP
jgi:predicted MFS family arabinose efflux permease